MWEIQELCGWSSSHIFGMYARIFMWSFRWRSTTSTMWIVHLRCEIFKHFSIEHFLGEFLLALWSTTLWLCTGAHISAENAWTKIDCVCMAKVAQAKISNNAFSSAVFLTSRRLCLTHSNFLYLSLSLVRFNCPLSASMNTSLFLVHISALLLGLLIFHWIYCCWICFCCGRARIKPNCRDTIDELNLKKVH